MKQCSKCKDLKEYKDFHKDKTMSDGFYSCCKKCKNLQKNIYSNSEAGKSKSKQYQQSEKGRITTRKAAAKYRSSLNGKEYRDNFSKSDKGKECQDKYRKSNKRKESLNKWKSNNPNKIKANSKVSNAIRDERLQPPSNFICQECKIAQAQEYHHWSYEPEYWLDVIPLCRSCHKNQTLIEQ